MTDRLNNLLMALEIPRQSGKTSLTARIVKASNGIFVCHSEGRAKVLSAKYGIKTTSTQNLVTLRGQTNVVYVDHYVISLALREALDKINKLEEENAKLYLRSTTVREESSKIDKLFHESIIALRDTQLKILAVESESFFQRLKRLFGYAN